MYDCRSPDTSYKTWDLGGEIEKLLWNTYNPMNFFVSVLHVVMIYLSIHLIVG